MTFQNVFFCFVIYSRMFKLWFVAITSIIDQNSNLIKMNEWIYRIRRICDRKIMITNVIKKCSKKKQFAIKKTHDFIYDDHQNLIFVCFFHFVFLNQTHWLFLWKVCIDNNNAWKFCSKLFYFEWYFTFSNFSSMILIFFNSFVIHWFIRHFSFYSSFLNQFFYSSFDFDILIINFHVVVFVVMIFLHRINNFRNFKFFVIEIEINVESVCVVVILEYKIWIKNVNFFKFVVFFVTKNSIFDNVQNEFVIKISISIQIRWIFFENIVKIALQLNWSSSRKSIQKNWFDFRVETIRNSRLDFSIRVEIVNTNFDDIFDDTRIESKIFNTRLDSSNLYN